MSQFYLNGPSKGCAMSAEEFAAEVRQRPGSQPCPTSGSGCDCGPAPAPPVPPAGCGCVGTMPPSNSDCPSDERGQSTARCKQMICCCRPAPAFPARPPRVDEGCCCKQSFRAALDLLRDQQISSLLDFDTAAFLTNTYTAGAALEAPAVPAATPSDNLPTELTGSFRRFAPCNCDLIDVDAPVYTAAGGDSVFTATQISLCQLDAVVIQIAAAAAEGGLTAEEAAARNFRCVRQRLAQLLNPCGDSCGQEHCSCPCDGRDCCCAAGLLSTLAQSRVSLVAGLLVLTGVTLLGAVGNVLVLSNETDKRLYFVCVNSVQFIG